MDKKTLGFLKELVEAPSPSGFEDPAQKVWCGYVKKFADEVRRDVHGNTIATINPKGSPKIMLCGHCDEIGFMVRYIDDNGYIYFAAIGGVDANLVPTQRVFIYTKKGKVLGVVGKKAIHLMDEEERRQSKAKIHSLWIDIGAKKKAEAEKLVSIGDPITFTVGFEELKNGLVTARGLDDKMGSFVVAEALRMIKAGKPKAAVFGVSTVQEEIGIEGSRASAYGLNPDIGIAIDVTHATDYPGADKKRTGEVKLGQGPVVSKGAHINPKVYDLLMESAKAKKIPYQISPSPGRTGTDADAIHNTRAGVAAAVVSVPNRYMHTPVEVIALTDLENASKLLAHFVLKLKPGVSFIRPMF